MAKEKAPTTAETASDSVETQSPKPLKPKALDVAAAQISSEVDSTVVPSRMPGSYLIVDPRMDGSPITVRFSAKEAPELVLDDIVDSSGQSGARKIAIPLDYLTRLMGFTALISYTGKAQGQAAQSLVKEVGISFYPASESENLAPYLLHEKIVHSTPTYDMHDHTGDETVLVPVPPLAKAGDKVYCTAVTEQDVVPYTFYTVVYGYVLSAEEAVAGHVLRFSIARGWLARRKPWGSITLQSAWITSGLQAEPPADVDPHLETRLPANALEIQRRRTAALIVAPGLDLPPPHLRQSVDYNNGWYLNPELTKEGGDVDVPGLDTYAGDRVCFYVSGPGYGQKPLGCVAIERDGDPASVKLSACIVACLFNKSMTLTYTLAFNESEQPSPDRVVNVLAPQLPRAVIEEATKHTVDLRTFAGDATATVPAWAYGECSKLCWMWITGKREDESDFRFDILMGAPVTDDWKKHGVDTLVSRVDLQELADCSDFELHFAASFCEASDLANAQAFPVHGFNIEQEPLVLLEPSVTEAVGTDLTAWNGRDGVHVEVDYVGNSPKHSISVCWQKPDGTCWPLAAQSGSDKVFFVPREAVIESMGKTVQITYTVTTACKLQTSLPLNLAITVPVRLPTPEVREAVPPAIDGGILDLRTFPGDARITLEKWWFMLSGQLGWLECAGIADENGAPYIIKVSTADPITSGDVDGGLNKLLKRTELEKLRNKTSLVVAFKATPDIGGVVGNAIAFPQLKLEFRKAYRDLTNFDDQTFGKWEEGAGVGDPRDLTIDSIDGPDGKPGYSVRNFTYTSNTVGPILQRLFNDLESGRTYRFSVQVRQYGHNPPAPQLSLSKDGVRQTDILTLSDLAWHKLEFTFLAEGGGVQLDIYSHRASGMGNDWYMDDFLVEELS
ncbi:hypothetical protein V6L78_12630 [Pseudomonas canadensis]|uniref:hypothetical protein n=1 Tax=Pseudomonas canadensis TaxID=915099 RepID=UPI0030D1BA64